MKHSLGCYVVRMLVFVAGTFALTFILMGVFALVHVIVPGVQTLSFVSAFAAALFVALVRSVIRHLVPDVPAKTEKVKK